MKNLFVMIAFMIIVPLYTQAQQCDCKQVLDKLITKIESDYPGFSVKTQEESLYPGFKADLVLASRKADQAACRSILKKYVDFFKDPHLWVGENGASFSADNNIAATKLTIDIPLFQGDIQQSKDPYEGIWSNETYTLGVKKTGDKEYTGFVIRSPFDTWQPGDIKFRLYTDGTFAYAMLDRSLKKGSYELLDNSILYLSDVSVALVKELPKPALNKVQIEARIKELDGFYAKRLSARTAILKLPSFEYQHLKTIDSLIEQNRSLLEGTENLIIDLRGNPGGTTDAYQKLLPYIAGKRIRNTGAEFLSTQAYIDNLEAYKKTLDKNVSTTGLDKQIAYLKAHLGEYVNYNESKEGPVYIENVVPNAKAPKHIVILANKLTGSSAEYFLFVARQSKKVKIFGKPSYGALDYGNAFIADFGCAPYQVFIPSYRALRLPDYPIDNIGIQPDVYMDKSIKDWVKFAQDYLEE